MEVLVADIQVLEERELAWKTSMTSKHPKLMGKQYACLEYLMVSVPSFLLSPDYRCHKKLPKLQYGC